MIPRTTIAAAARRGFHTTRARLSSPYHYAEGPRTNLPFNVHGRFFRLGFWTYAATGFFMPFGIAIWQTNRPKA